MALTAGVAVFTAHGELGVAGVLHPCITKDVEVRVVNSKLPSIPMSIGAGRCFLRFGHVDLLP